MKKYLVILLSGVIIGALLGTLVECDGPKCPDVKTNTIIEYKDRIVTVPTDEIVYLPGEVKDTTIYKNRRVVDTIIETDTIYKFIEVPIYTNKYIKPFEFKTDSTSIEGIANIVADSLYSFNIDSLKFSYKEKTITNNNTIYKNKHNLYLGTTIGFDKTSLRSTGFGLYYGNNKLLIGAGVDYNFNTDDIIYQGTVGVRLFNKHKNK